MKYEASEAKRTDAPPGAAVVVLIIATEEGKSAAGTVELDRRGNLISASRNLQPDPSCIDAALLETARKAARDAGVIPPVPYPERAITGRPRILRMVDAEDSDANGEGCVVVVDDPAAVIASGRYRGPKEAPPNRDFVRRPAALPGRKYLNLTNEEGQGIQPDNMEDVGMCLDIQHLKLVLSDSFATVYRDLQDAEEAIRLARAHQVLPAEATR